jgi:putative transposase
MRFCDSIFGQLLEPVQRRWFDGVVERLEADAYDKTLKSWQHLAALVYAQLSGVKGLRGLVAVWNAHAQHHYHLGVGPLSRSALSDANARRPLAVFTQTFAMLAGLADRTTRREGDAMVRLIDSTPIPLGQIVKWAKWNGRIRGLKLHVAYDPLRDIPTQIEITDANVNDVQIGERFAITAGHTYVFDKAYCKYPWWTAIHQKAALFVTRQKTTTRLRATRWRKVHKHKGDGFTVIDDAEVKLVSKGDSQLAIPMRRIRLRRDKGARITLVTNDLKRPAAQIAALYKKRWDIELLFRWIKQHLKIDHFIGNNDNAVRLQIVAAMIAYLLLRIAARQNLVKIPIIRFAELLTTRLFTRNRIERIDKPPQVHPATARSCCSNDQLEFRYA